PPYPEPAIARAEIEKTGGHPQTPGLAAPLLRGRRVCAGRGVGAQHTRPRSAHLIPHGVSCGPLLMRHVCCPPTSLWACGTRPALLARVTKPAPAAAPSRRRPPRSGPLPPGAAIAQ